MSDDDTDREGWRNAVLAAALAVVAVGLVGGMYWVMGSMPGPTVAVSAVQRSPTTTITDVSTPVPTTPPAVAPPVASWTQTDTPSLPPPEQPTMTAPVAGQTADPVPGQPSPTTPATQPTTPAPPPAAPSVANVKLTCSKSQGKRVTAQLSFTTTTKVDVIVAAGGQVDRKSVGPGAASVSTSGRGPEFCVANVAGQTVGPIPAS